MSKAIESRGRPLGLAGAGGRARCRGDPEKCDEGHLSFVTNPAPPPHLREAAASSSRATHGETKPRPQSWCRACRGPARAGRLGGPHLHPFAGALPLCRVWPSLWAWGSTL